VLSSLLGGGQLQCCNYQVGPLPGAKAQQMVAGRQARSLFVTLPGTVPGTPTPYSGYLVGVHNSLAVS
jgi:hypothetical protein